MLFLSVVQNYFLWHYTRALKEVFNVWLNLLWFVVHFFSLPQMLRSWFSPWKRIVESRGETWNMEDLAAFLLVGLLSRLLGFIIRSLVIITGSLALGASILLGTTIFFIWFLLPIIILGAFGVGLVFLIR